VGVATINHKPCCIDSIQVTSSVDRKADSPPDMQCTAWSLRTECARRQMHRGLAFTEQAHACCDRPSNLGRTFALPSLPILDKQWHFQVWLSVVGRRSQTQRRIKLDPIIDHELPLPFCAVPHSPTSALSLMILSAFPHLRASHPPRCTCFGPW
jgi:hypothetical protein